jgi:DNA-binding response OmpR family regulator
VKIDPTTTPLRIVLAAEDEEGDATLLRLAFRRAGIPHPLIVVHDGQEALDYLSGNAPYTDRVSYPMPGLLLLDVKMPRLNGFDVLAWWITRPELRDLPVVVLSSSCHESDMTKARMMGAREYIVKPHGFMQLSNIMQDLCRRHLSAVMATA